MALIQRADLVERMRRAFGLRERGVGSTVSPELVPVVIVEDLTGPSIDEGYPREALAIVSAGASAGVYSEVFLYNPEGSAVDLIVELLWTRMSASGTGIVRLGATTALNNLLGTQTERLNQDMRVQAIPNGRIDSRNQAAVVTATRTFSLFQQSTSWQANPVAITLPPGTYLSFVPQANNTGAYIMAWWTERLRTTT